MLNDDIRSESYQETAILEKPDIHIVRSTHITEDFKEELKRCIYKQLDNNRHTKTSIIELKSIQDIKDVYNQSVYEDICNNIASKPQTPNTSPIDIYAKNSKHPRIVVNGKKIKITHGIIVLAYEKLRKIFDDDIKKLSNKNISDIIVHALNISDGLVITSKSYKVELSLIIIRKLIDEEVKNSDQNTILHMIVESSMPNLISLHMIHCNIIYRLLSKCTCLRHLNS